MQHVWTAHVCFVQSKTKLQGANRPAVAGFQASQGFEIYFMQLLGSVCGFLGLFFCFGLFWFGVFFCFDFFLPVLLSITFMYGTYDGSSSL